MSEHGDAPVAQVPGRSTGAGPAAPTADSTAPAPASSTSTSPGERVPLYVHVLTLAVVLQFMSGSSTIYLMPLPPDRLALAAGVLLFLVHPDLWRSGPRLAGVHVLMGALIAWCVGSLLWFGVVGNPTGLFALVDSIGVVPFLLFLTAPVVFATRARRHVLIRALTWLGLYLGYVSVAEGLHLYSLIVPPGIVDPSHTHFGRAMGPSQQVASNGLALLACLYPSALYAVRSRGWRRALGAVAGLACAAGACFTLTRSIWLALVIGAVFVVVAEPRARLRLSAVLVVAGLVVGAAFALAPSIGGEVSERTQASRSVYDRLNANAAAVRVVLAQPLSGVGLNRFHEVESAWVWQSPDYPITNMGIDVHNVVLGYAAELGLPGLTLWLLTLGYGLWAAATGPRRRDGPLRDLRVGAFAFALAWGTVAMLAPIKYALPTSVLWLGLGMVADHRALGWTRVPQGCAAADDSGPAGGESVRGPGRGPAGDSGRQQESGEQERPGERRARGRGHDPRPRRGRGREHDRDHDHDHDHDHPRGPDREKVEV